MVIKFLPWARVHPIQRLIERTLLVMESDRVGRMAHTPIGSLLPEGVIDPRPNHRSQFSPNIEEPFFVVKRFRRIQTLGGPWQGWRQEYGEPSMAILTGVGVRLFGMDQAGFQLVPCGPSSRRIPKALARVRIWSAKPQSFARRAASLWAINSMICSSRRPLDSKNFFR